MLLSEIYKIADELAPKTLSVECCQTYGYYDNSGVLIDTGEDIKGIVFSLDLSNATIEKAIKEKANLIITHHPAIYGKIGDIRVDDNTLLGGKIVKCIKNGISLISMHLNLDFAKDGTDESLMEGICLASGKTEGAGTGLRCMQPLSIGCYGRAYDIKKTPLKTLCENMEKEFSSRKILFYGEEEKEIKRIASFCGAGADERAVVFAKEQGADAIVSSDFKHHILALAQELGLSVIVMTHYASECYGFKKYYEKICRQVTVPCVYHTDENLL